MFIVFRSFLVTALALLSLIAHASPSVSVYYGKGLSPSSLALYDISVVEPGHGYDPVAYRKAWPTSELYAYASVAEVGRERDYFSKIPTAWQMARNGAWNSVVIDQTPEQWPAFFADEVIAPLWNKGYRGFFLDTMDSYRLAEKFSEEDQQAGLVRVIQKLNAQFPGIKLILNRGFEIVPRVRDQIQMVAAESLFRGWDASNKRYIDISPKDREWILGQLQSIRERDKLPVLSIDYVPPHDREAMRDVVKKIEALGIIPWVTDADLRTQGMGTIEAQARRVLILRNGAEVPALNLSAAHRFLEMPLNYMGYIADYADIREPLPTDIDRDRYAGVVTWFNGAIPDRKIKEVRDWLKAQSLKKMPILVLSASGFPINKALPFGANHTEVTPTLPLKKVKESSIYNFETQTLAPDNEFEGWTLTPEIQQQSEELLSFDDAKGRRFVSAAVTPWGGFVLNPYLVEELPGVDQARWVINPFSMLRKALRLTDFPVPDITTESGRRLLLSHVDGDAFPSKAELPGTPFSAEVLQREILQRYRIPHTVSIVEAEISPQGLFPQLSSKLENIARSIFKMPNVEIASHSYSHPFYWVPESQKTSVSKEVNLNLNIPGYTMNMDREINGSMDYIRKNLAPPGKPVEVMLWSGDTAPGEDALAIIDAGGLLNMNGGDTYITRANPSLTAVGSWGIQKGGHLQVYAPITNENIYTNLWHGPFYGFEKVIETFEMTGSPRRLKAIDVYYHFYSATKVASLKALHSAYQWALKQDTYPIFVSEYVRKVQDYYEFAVARQGDKWILRSPGRLRTVRLPPSLGLPLMEHSSGIAGYKNGPDGNYAHLAQGAASMLTAEKSSAQQPAYLQEANARVTEWESLPDGGMRFTLQGHMPLEWKMYLPPHCSQSSSPKELTTVKAGASSDHIRSFRSNQNSAKLEVQCSAQ